MDGSAVCCECGDVVRGVVCHDADGCHSLHFGCSGLRLSHCSCAGYPLATPPRPPLMPSKRVRVPFADLTNVSNVPATSSQATPAPRRGSRWSLGHIDMDCMSNDTSPTRTEFDTSPSNTSEFSFGDSSSMEWDDMQESPKSLAVQVIALSGQQLCELCISPSTSVLGIKIRLEKILLVSVRQQDLLWGFRLLHDHQSLGSTVLQDELASVARISINLVSKAPSPQPNYLGFQENVTKRHRYMLVDWLISMHTSEEVQQRSLFLAVSFIDLYLSQRQLERKNLKLLGIAAFLIARKCDIAAPHSEPIASSSPLNNFQREQIAPTSANSDMFGRWAGNAYTDAEVVSMERDVINVIGLHSTTAYHHSVVSDYLKPFHSLGIFGQRHLKLMAWLAEHSLMSLSMLQHDPSRIAAAAVLTSNRLMGWDVLWPAAISKELPYQEHELRQCSRGLDRVVSCLTSPNSEYKALQKKFPDFHPNGPSVNAARGGA